MRARTPTPSVHAPPIARFSPQFFLVSSQAGSRFNFLVRLFSSSRSILRKYPESRSGRVHGRQFRPPPRSRVRFVNVVETTRFDRDASTRCLLPLPFIPSYFDRTISRVNACQKGVSRRMDFLLSSFIYPPAKIIRSEIDLRLFHPSRNRFDRRAYRQR